MKSFLKLRVDDRVVFRKPHPCGSFEWIITRVGADIGAQCLKCGHRILLPREVFERKVRKHFPAKQEADLWRVDLEGSSPSAQ
jgi:hypothetical protein